MAGLLTQPIVQRRGNRPYRIGRVYPLLAGYVGKNSPTAATDDHVFNPASRYGDGVAWTSVYLPVGGFFDWWAVEADAQQIVHGEHDWGRMFALCSSNNKNVGAVNVYSRINGLRGRQVGTFASGSVFGSFGLTADSGLYDRVRDGDKICWEVEMTGSGYIAINQISSRFIDQLRLGDHDGDHVIGLGAPASWRNYSSKGYGYVEAHAGAAPVYGPPGPGGWIGSATEADWRIVTNMPGGYTHRGFATYMNFNTLSVTFYNGLLNGGAELQSEITVPPGATGWYEQFGNDWIAPTNGISAIDRYSSADGTNWWAQAQIQEMWNGQDKMILACIDDRPGGGATGIAINKTLQMPVCGQATPVNLGNNYSVVASLFPAGTLRNLFVKAATNGFTAATATFTVYVNNVATALTVTIAAGGTTLVADTTHSVQINNGDIVSIQFVSTNTGSGTFGPAMYGFGFTPL